MTNVGTLVLGAGPTGIGAAWQLHEAGDQDWLLLDAADRAGGMAVTETDDRGFRWDLGGHVIHSHFAYFDAVLAHHRDWAFPRRGGWVRIGQEWCPTPIQHHLGNLRQGGQISRELARLPAQFSARDLGQFYQRSFGPTLDGLFFSPFNAKQWAWPLEELSHTWTSLRSGSTARNVPAPRTDLSASDKPEDSSTFPYPVLGTGSLWQALADMLPVSRQRYSTRVVRIDLTARRVSLDNGDEIAYQHCISTLPLSALLHLVAHERPHLAIRIPELKYSSTHAVGLGFTGRLPDVLAEKSWIYSADPSVMFHRATVASHFSSELSGSGRWSVLFETSSSAHRQVDVDGLPYAHLEVLRSWGIEDAPISVWQKNLELGYPLPFRGRDDLLAQVLPELEACGVLPRGRFGGWRYETSNQDYAFMQGVEAVLALSTGRPETVYWPGRAEHPSQDRDMTSPAPAA